MKCMKMRYLDTYQVKSNLIKDKNLWEWSLEEEKCVWDVK